MSDDNPTVEVNGTELEIIETEDGFEAREVPDEPDPNTVEKFAEEVAEEGDSIAVGHIDKLSQMSNFSGPSGVQVYVSREGYDVVRDLLSNAMDSGWNPHKIEFEQGYVRFRDTEA